MGVGRDAVHWVGGGGPGSGRCIDWEVPGDHGKGGAEAVWPPLDVTGLEFRIEISARPRGLEVREFPVHLREHNAGKQWPGYPSRILPGAEVTTGVAKMPPSLIPISSWRWHSL